MKKARAHRCPCSSPLSHVYFQVNGVIQFQVMNDAKDTAHWTIDLKKTCRVYKGEAPKADVTIILSDATLVDLAAGKVWHFMHCILD